MKEKAVGIDVGGTKIRGILYGGKVLKCAEAPTPSSLAGFNSVLDEIIRKLGVLEKSKIAVAAAGIIEGNRLVGSPNIPYIKNFVFPAMKIDNDARCFARAELSRIKAKKVFYAVLGTGVGRAFSKGKKVEKIKKFEYPEVWEKEFQRICRLMDDEKLADFLGEKINLLAEPYQPEIIILGGGLLNRKGLFKRIKRELRFPAKRAFFKKNSAAIGATMLLNKF